MIVTWFYIMVGIVFIILGLILFFRPTYIKMVLGAILERDLFIIPGIAEILLGLGTLYFRQAANLVWFVYVAGLMLFIDGVFYLAAAKRMREAYRYFLKADNKGFKTYGIFMFIIALGYIIAGAPVKL